MKSAEEVLIVTVNTEKLEKLKKNILNMEEAFYASIQTEIELYGHVMGKPSTLYEWLEEVAKEWELPMESVLATCAQAKAEFFGDI